MNHNLNKEEKDFLDSYENDEWVSIKETEDIAKYKAIAKNTVLFRIPCKMFHK
jgi:hypothetical protein